jgi:hypothetical protein
VVGKATAGLADTFKQGVSFIGCVAQSVSAGGLRKMNVASGAYFKANPENFGSPIKGGELGAVPEWLKVESHPGNGQPDPVRSLLTFFPEMVQEHQAVPMPKGEKLASMDLVQQLEETFKKALSTDAQLLLDWLLANRPEQWVKFKGKDGRDMTFINFLSDHKINAEARDEIIQELLRAEKIELSPESDQLKLA